MLGISLLNRNGVGDTTNAIDAILNSTFDDYKIFLLDNGSKKNEAEILKKKYVNNNKLVINRVESNLGFCGGNNYNISLIKGSGEFDYVMLLSNDCLVDKNFLFDFMNQIKLFGKKGIYGPIIKNSNGAVQAIGANMDLWTGVSTRFKTINKDILSVDYVTGACMVIPMDLINRIGGLDEQYFAYWEESDFCFRGKQQGYPSFAINVSGVTHKEEAANRKIRPYYAYLMFRNRIIFLKRHAALFQYLFSYIPLLGYLLIIFPKKFGLKNYKYAIRGIFDGIKGKGNRELMILCK